MLFTHRIPTSQYAYIEFQSEHASVQEAMSEHKHANTIYNEQGDLSHKEWVAIRNNMLATGECDPNETHRMSASQRWFINELKLGIRAHSPDEPIIE